MQKIFFVLTSFLRDFYCVSVKFCHKMKTICAYGKIEMQNFDADFRADTFVSLNVTNWYPYQGRRYSFQT